MNVRTDNSLYQVIGKGTLIEAKKLFEHGNSGRVRVRDVFRGPRLKLEVGIPMCLFDASGKCVLETSNVVSIEG